MRHAVIVRIEADAKATATYYADAGEAKALFRQLDVPVDGGELQLWRTGHGKPRIKRSKEPTPAPVAEVLPVVTPEPEIKDAPPVQHSIKSKSQKGR